MKKALIFTQCILVAMTLFGGKAFSEGRHTYSCFSFDWNGHDGERGTMNLEIRGKNATATVFSDSGELIERIGGSLNPKYRSRGAVPFVKFGHGLIAEKILMTGGRKLRDGTFGGIARYEGEAEGGFFQYKFICKSKVEG